MGRKLPPCPPGISPALIDACDRFFRLIADHGCYHPKQLVSYCGERLGRALLKAELSDVHDYAAHRGARPTKHSPSSTKPRPQTMQLPVRRRRAFPKGKHDKFSLDLFGGR